MPFIDLIDDSESFERDRAALGYVPNFARLFAHRPAVYEAWIQLKDTISGSMDLRSSTARCSPTGSWSRRRCATSSSTTETRASQGRRGRRRPRREGGRRRHGGDRSRRRALARPRLSDADIFDVVAAAAARCFFSKTLDALCIQADPVLAELDPELREVLAVGRPIAASNA